MRSMVDDVVGAAADVAEKRSCASKLDEMMEAVQKLKRTSTMRSMVDDVVDGAADAAERAADAAENDHVPPSSTK